MGLAVDIGARRHWQRLPVIAACAWLALGNAQAGTLQVTITSQGKPATDAVVSLHSPAAVAATRAGRAVIDQRDIQFVPRVTVVPVGTTVRFPNSDNVRHQVYSFSPAKRFELPLYAGRAAAPVVFSTPGVVELGCNIHDWMLAYVVVVDTPYAGVADARGNSRIEAPAGPYTLRVWHPRLAGGKPHEEPVVLAEAIVRKQVSLVLVDQAEPAAPADDKLRALQEKFRKLRKDK